jgi:hypothetical protein
MNKQIGISSLLSAALVAGAVLVGSVVSASANGTEEDAAAPQGSFVSTMAVPESRQTAAYAGSQSVAVWSVSEEDAAVPPGSFNTAMAVPDDRAGLVKLASNHK